MTRLITVFAALLLLGCDSTTSSTGNTGGSGNGGGTPAADGEKLTVVVAVIDSLMPEDIDGTAMPNVSGLIDNGTIFMESRSVFSAETIPNHVAMMTGVYPDRNGIPTNNFWDKEALPASPGDEDLDNPNEVTAKTLFTWIDEQCRQGATPRNADIKHAAVLSKTYLWEVFRGDDVDPQANDIGLTNIPPDSHWDPQTSPGYIGPQSEHTIDVFTGQEAVATLPDADFIFINLGDVDRSSHASGTAGRQVTRFSADQQIGNIVSALQSADRWRNTVMLVVSDHGMDFSDPVSNVFTGLPPFNDGAFNTLLNSVSTQPLLDSLAGAACGFEPMLAVQNGGTNSLVVTNLAASATEVEDTLLAARSCLTNFDGSDAGQPGCETTVGNACYLTLTAPANVDAIEQAWYANPALYNGAALRGNLAADVGGIMPATIKSRHENLGDLVLAIGAGFKFSESDASGNPIPGNHGHMPTIHNTMIVSGGADFLLTSNAITGDADHFVRAANQSENIDVAATVAWLLGLNISDSQFPDAGASLPDYGDSAVRSGFDGRVLNEAFSSSASPSNCGVLPAP